MGVGRASVEEVAQAVAAVVAAGRSQADLAEALGKRRQTVTEWLNGTSARPSVTRAQLADAVARLTGTAAPVAADARRYTASILSLLEGDAMTIRDVAARQLAKLAEARAQLGLGGVTPGGEDAGTRARENLRVAEAASAYRAPRKAKGR